LLSQEGYHQYAVATTDTAFKKMLSPTMGSHQDSSIIASFLNSFVPAFRKDPVYDVTEHSAVPPKRPEEKKMFMDMHVVSTEGVEYIIQMQARPLDERALFYACSTYMHQFLEITSDQHFWGQTLKPVIALQILDYDSMHHKAKRSPLNELQYARHYSLTDESGDAIDYLQVVQVELPQAELQESLFPPKATFSNVQWWVSLLKHAHECTAMDVTLWRQELGMPDAIFAAFNRLDLHKWNNTETSEYKKDLTNRHLYATELADEREEGRKEALLKVAAGMKRHGMPLDLIAHVTGLHSDTIVNLPM